MVFEEVLNHMTDDELRNYLYHIDLLLEKTNELWYTQLELSTAFEQVYSKAKWNHECLESRNNLLMDIRGIEDKLLKKYEQYVPRPVCCEKGEANHENA